MASFADVLAAYAQAADRDTIELQALDFTGDLTFDKEISVVLRGGYDCGYADPHGTARLLGKLKLTRGTVKPEGIRFQ